ncbi:MAG: citrate (Si)-synthase, partial [Victivallales bacterium]|nr:citrate (Si)-synthase [Victivallales bacterium]
IAAFSYKKNMGEPIVYPRSDLRYCENFLNMMFHTPVNGYAPDPVVTRALNQLLILHADHEQNCSTSVVKAVGSSQANLYASISSGVCALWGALHGGANQQVIEMLESVTRSGESVQSLIERAKDKSDPFKLFGFGHRVYKTYDPRARVAKKICKTVIAHMQTNDPMLELAQELEEAALADPFFQDRHLYPNVDFYTGLTYRAMGIPTNMFTVMFAIGRLPGWIAQWREQRDNSENKIVRPRQIYVGPSRRTVADTLASAPYAPAAGIR